MTNLPANLSPHLYLDLIGKPWSAGARGPEAYDCLGLVIEIQRRRGITGPKFLSCEAELHRQLAAGGFLAGCKKLEDPEPGCVALLRTGIHEHHMGVMINRFHMVHTTAQTLGVVKESILGPLWERRLLGFYQIGIVDAEPMPNPWGPA